MDQLRSRDRRLDKVHPKKELMLGDLFDLGEAQIRPKCQSIVSLVNHHSYRLGRVSSIVIVLYAEVFKEKHQLLLLVFVVLLDDLHLDYLFR